MISSRYVRETSLSTSPRFSERDMVNCIASHLRDAGYKIRAQVPNMGQIADLVVQRNRWLTAIEAKRHDWRRALAQCRAHESVADFICVAIGTQSISHPLLQEVEATGYGLIHFRPGDRTCNWVIKPKFNRKIWRPQRQRFLQVLRSIHDVV